MSEFHIKVVKLGPILKHTNATSLEITMVHGGYPVITRMGEFREGDLAVYVPVDAEVPASDPRWAFLGEHRRIQAKRLRGTFSMGLLTKAEPEWVEGQDVRELLGIVKYEPDEPDDRLTTGGGLDEKDPGFLPTYSDIEGFRRWPTIIESGEEVVLTEKLHGESSRYVFEDGRLWVGSRTRIKRDDPSSQWWRAARAYNLAEKLAKAPGIAVYGEVHGYTKGFNYGVAKGTVGFRAFDAMDIKTRQYLDVDAFLALMTTLDIPTVPFLYRGPWSEELKGYAEGLSTLSEHTREGFVVRPTKERVHLELGRVILKYIGEAYLLGKGKH